MTRPALSALVVSGSEIKYRLEAERTETGSFVHVDWLRFTVYRRNALSIGDCDVVWEPPPPVTLDNFWDPARRQRHFVSLLRDLDGADVFAAGVEASELAREVCEVLGPDFVSATEPGKGHDFYKYRLSILRNEVEVGWVGFLASGDSPKQTAQSKTLHVNLYGMACTFGAAGWRERMADLIDRRKGDITRADLALDYFDGLDGGLDGVLREYQSGAMDVQGKRLKCNMLGDWANGAERSFYFGSKEAGKQTNVYEKGHQLFGVKEANPWVRIELRYGNKLRILSTDLLRRPADFFGGASDWHALKLAQAGQTITPQKIPREQRLPMETVNAEVTRNLRWALTTAGPTIAAAFQFLGSEFLQLCTASRLPGRLAKFSPSEVKAAFERVSATVLPTGDFSPYPA